MCGEGGAEYGVEGCCLGSYAGEGCLVRMRMLVVWCLFRSRLGGDGVYACDNL